jgi:hypothetical protein
LQRQVLSHSAFPAYRRRGVKAPENFCLDGAKFSYGRSEIFVGQKKIFAGQKFDAVKALIYKAFKKPLFRLPESQFSSYYCFLLLYFPKKRKSALYARHAV